MINNNLCIFDLLFDEYKIITLKDIDLKIKVYTNGIIETLEKNYKTKNGKNYHRQGKILKPAIDKDGYYRYTFSKKGKRKSLYGHRIVAMAYLKDYSDNLQVNHKNGIKTDNNYTNLEMVTLQENIRHSIVNKLKPKMIRNSYGRFIGKESDF